jgi:acyl-CoA synthetase (AMP-forming)/AMP-acid ligase II
MFYCFPSMLSEKRSTSLPALTLRDLLSKAAHNHPDAVALVDEYSGQNAIETTYAQLLERSTMLAKHLYYKFSCKKGDVVAIYG